MDSVALVSSSLDQARDLTVEAAQAIGIGKLLGSGSSLKGVPFAKLKALLDSRNDREILEALKKVISMIYENKPCLPYFSSVVKNVTNPNIEVKKLIYIYLLHYAETDQDLALLSVNAIQKSLTDQNPQVRALALRTMAGMKVPLISQIVSLAIKRGAGDMSPLVRKAAALAIPKCYALDPNTLPQLLDHLSTLLGDKQYFVVGPAVQSFLAVCPDRIDLLHKPYRSLVRKLVDMDEWSQQATLNVLIRYARQCFPRQTKKATRVDKRDFYDDEQVEVVETGEVIQVLDPDLELFLKACQTLLTSRSAGVIITVAKVFLHLDMLSYLELAIGPLVSLLRGPEEVEQAVLYSLVSVALEYPALLVPFASRFLICAADAPNVWRLKMEILTLIFPHSQLRLKALILSELEHFSHSSDVDKIREAVGAIGQCAQSSPDATTSSRCFRVLLNQISSFEEVLVSEVLTVMRHLIQRDPASHGKTVVRLARNLDRTSSPQARATIIWLVGEFASLYPEMQIAADVLRILLKGFASESEPAKLQIVLLAAKVYLLWLQSQRIQTEQQLLVDDGDKGQTTSTFGPGGDDTEHPVPKLWHYVLLLARYDTSYDLRDRSRLFRNLLTNADATQLAALLLLAPKPVPQSPSPSEGRKGLLLGSATLALGKEVTGLHGLMGYEELPDWVEAGKEPNATLRETEVVGNLEQKPGMMAASQKLDEAVRAQGLEMVVHSQASREQGLAEDMNPLPQSGKGEKERKGFRQVFGRIKTVFKDKDASTSGQRASTSAPLVAPGDLASATRAASQRTPADDSTPAPQPSSRIMEPGSDKPPSNVEADARLQKIKAALEKYDYLFDQDDRDVPITISDYRGVRDVPQERVQKNIRMRVKYTCHHCQTVYGSVKICISCHHKRCPDCIRYPPKKKGKGEVVPQDKQEPGYVGEGTGQTGAESQCACHECRTEFELGAVECPNCHHHICSLCLKKPELTIAIEPETSSAGTDSKPSERAEGKPRPGADTTSASAS
ncbi:hypothetical protein DV736_g5181, partial [Chaetothyriales sp. CBS 134916]